MSKTPHDNAHGSTAEKKTPQFKKQPRACTTEHKDRIGKKEYTYTATCGHTKVREDNGTPIGSMFSIDYIVPQDDALRPVTFAFNGGPGSASVPINVGGIGPRIVKPNADKRIGPAPYTIQDNPYTVLHMSDLVVVDALGTGWSELAEGVEGKRAYGVDKDADCFARFIEAWLTKHNRWASPVYIFGESYGTTRNAVLVRMLEERGIAVNGVIMLSAIFDWAPTNPGNDGCYVQLFPSYASIARYHGKASAFKDLDEDAFFDAAAEFAEDKLAAALLKGDRLTPEHEAALAEEMSSMIGLSAEYLCEKHLRVELTDFRCELLKDEKRVCGRFDGRFTYDAGNFLQTSREGTMEDDPSDSAMSAAWAQVWHQIVHDELGYNCPRPYVQGNWEEVNKEWDHKHTSAGAAWDSTSPNVAFDLATTMRKNPNLRVLMLGGRYDLATPYLGPIEDLSKMYLAKPLKDNITWHLYDAGHMVYVNPKVLKKLYSDLETFYAGSTPKR